MIETALTCRLGLKWPIFQAPMAGGGDTPALVASVSAAGGLGFIGAAYLAPAQIAAAARAVRAHTERPFGINLFAPLPAPVPPNTIAAALERLAPFHAELGLPPPALPEASGPAFADQLAAILDSGAAVLSVTFGLLPPEATAAAKARGMMVIGTATTIEEAAMVEAAGMDAVVAQGSEAGGHRGSFAAEFSAAMIGTMALVPQVLDAVRLPVIASGGIMDGRGVAAALALGASAVQMGTAFLTCDEAGVAEAHKAAILAARPQETRVTRAFSGRPARGIVNRFMIEIEAEDAADAILPFPLQNALTRPLRSAAAEQGRAEFLSLWAGQGLGLARRQPAAALLARLGLETQAACRGLAAAMSENSSQAEAGERREPEAETPVAILAAAIPPRRIASNYPPPFAARMAGREKRPLGDVFGLRRFGVNLTRLAPGAVSSLLHRHSRQDEFILVLEGEPTLITERGETLLHPGMCAGFPAAGPAHHLVNRSGRDVVYVEIGDRTAGDEVSYPEDDLVAQRGADGRWIFTRKDGTPYGA